MITSYAGKGRGCLREMLNQPEMEWHALGRVITVCRAPVPPLKELQRLLGSQTLPKWHQ